MSRYDEYIELVDNELLNPVDRVKLFPAAINVFNELPDDQFILLTKYSQVFGIAPLFYNIEPTAGDDPSVLRGAYYYGSKLTIMTPDIHATITGAGVDNVSTVYNADLGSVYHIIELSDPEKDITITLEEVI